jgi:hypothetical protein
MAHALGLELADLAQMNRICADVLEKAHPIAEQIGVTSRYISSTRPSLKACCATLAPPIPTYFPFANAFASATADSMPSVTKTSFDLPLVGF